MTDLLTERASFTRMDRSTRHDWDVIGRHLADYTANTLADRILAELAHMGDEHGGFAVDRLTHSLQTAHLAEQDGCDEEYLVCALVHDIGDGLAPLNHCDLAAAVVKPYVSEANHWMVKYHGVLQGYYFWHHIGLDRNARDALKGCEHYERTEEFCAKYDMLAFDPDGVTPPLSHYEPLIRSTFTHVDFAEG